ncbi:MAG TPA: ABC transporter permease [Solirubrobacter sp.]|nr:ABC transporter permease [Solirubrobacter sp.]
MSGSYAVFVARRAVAAVLVTFAVSAITFVILHVLAPWGFADTRALPVELLSYHERVFFHLDFGISRQQPFQPVATMLADALPADVALMAGALVVGLALGVAGGVVCAQRPGSLRARVLEGAAAVFLCAPVYFVGMMVILIFGPSVDGPIPIFLVTTNAYAGLFDDPLAWLRALCVPWVVAGLPLAAMVLRMVRATLPETMQEEFVRTAAGKGLSPRRVTVWHALPVALPPTLSLAGAYAPMLLANVVLVEAVFGIPGMYRLIPGALDNANFPVLQALVFAGTVVVVLCTAVTDIALAALDPRVRA